MADVDKLQYEPPLSTVVVNNDPLSLMNELPLPWSLSGMPAADKSAVEGLTAARPPRSSLPPAQEYLSTKETVDNDDDKSQQTVKLADISDWIHLTTIAPMCHDTILEAARYASKPEINSKIFVCLPEQYPFLEVDCLVYRAPDRTEVSKKLLSQAGPKFIKRLSEKKALKSGEVTVIFDHNLPGAKAIACAPGVDMANPRFINSIDAMVAKVYKNLLTAMMQIEDQEGEEKKKKKRGKVDTIAICGLYPLNSEMIDGIHACLRVIRKALEMQAFSKLKAVVLCPIADEVSILAETLPYYFPRNRNEELLGFYLPQLNMTEWGEVAKEEEHQHKLVKRPGRCPDFNSLAYEVDRQNESEEAFQAFRWCQEQDSATGGGGKKSSTGSDSQAASRKMKELQQRVRPYNRLLIEAKKHNYSGKLQKFMLSCGLNKYGVQTVILIGQYLPFRDPVLMNEAFLFFIDFMDQMANEPFSVIFFCPRTKIGLTNYEWQDMFLSLDEKYGRNLCTLYVVHSTLVGRINTWAMTTFRLSVLKDKIKFVNSLLSLDELIDISTLALPTVVYEQEAIVQSKNSSLRNFNPSS